MYTANGSVAITKHLLLEEGSEEATKNSCDHTSQDTSCSAVRPYK